MKKKIILIWLVLFTIPAYSGVTGVGTTAASFLEIEVGSRAIGMGCAFGGVADDATAIYWNPAGLSRLTKNEFTFTHTMWFLDFKYDFAGGVLDIGRFGAFGLSFTSLTSSDMMVRTIEEPEGTGERFSVGSMAIGLSYAINLSDKFSIGFNTKYIEERIWHMAASSFAVDFGTLFITPFNDMKLGMTISNFGTDMRLAGRDVVVYHDLDETILGNNERIPAHLETEQWPLPLIFRAGLAMNLLENRNNRITIALDAVHPNNNSEYINFGVEYVLKNMLFLRGGYSALYKRDSDEGPTVGAGIHSKVGENINLKFDYAFMQFYHLGYTHRISFGLEF